MDVYSEEELLIAASDAIRRIMENDVKKKGEEIFKANVEKYIYSAYSPSVYGRRHQIGNKTYSEITYAGNYSYEYEVTSTESTVSIYPNGEPYIPPFLYQKGGFVAMLDKGDLGWWRKKFPRPALTRTQSQFDRGYLSSAIRTGIKREFG